MDAIPQVGRHLVVIGLLVAAIGGALMLDGRIPWIGRLPGDITIARGNFRLYIPLGTCLLASAILTAVFRLLGRR